MTNTIVGSERYYFNMYRDTENYGEASEYVFCDELEEYTFYPYVNKLKSIPGYTELNPYIKAVNIFLYYEQEEKIREVQCNIVQSYKRIYITEGNFNKYWRKISEDICKAIWKKTNSIEITQISINRNVDVSLLNTETRTAKVNNSFKIEYEGKTVDIENDDFKAIEELPTNATLCVSKKINWWRQLWERVQQFLFSNPEKQDTSKIDSKEKRPRTLKRGDVYYADLSGIEHSVGCEQNGNRPVLIVQNDIGNKYSPTTIVAILTSKKKKKLPTHVILSDFAGLPLVSEVCLEQIKTIDKARLGKYRGNIGKEKMQEVEQAILVSVGIHSK